MKTVQSCSDILERREIEGAPLLRERGDGLVLAERSLWPYAIMGAVFVVLGTAMSSVWFAMLATVNRYANDWLLIVAGFAVLGMGLLICARSELYFARKSLELHRRT